MKVNDWLGRAVEDLTATDVPTAKLDALILLEDALLKDRSYIIAHLEDKLPPKLAMGLNKQIKRRCRHEPLAFIRGKTEFYGREFVINKTVLEPRPESETMIDLLKSLLFPVKATILDLGTGSGALAITAKLEHPKAEVLATDIDKKCLAVARQNANKHKVDVKFLYGDLLRPVNTKIDAVLANLPYVPDDFRLNKAAENEPKIAIFGGPDGLDIYRRLFEQINNSEHKPKFILTESLPFQHKNLAQIAKQAGYKLTKTADFIQVYQFLR